MPIYLQNINFQINVGNYNSPSPSHSEAFSLLTQETPQWMARKGNNKETPEWVDRDDSSSNAATNKFVFQEERPPPQQQQQQLNAPKVTNIVRALGF